MSKEKIPSRRDRARKRHNKNPVIPLIVILAGIAFLIWGGYTLLRSRQSESVKIPIEVIGSPSLKVDQELVDFGDVQVNKIVSVTFNLSNVGDQKLRFTGQPYVTVMEGC